MNALSLSRQLKRKFGVVKITEKEKLRLTDSGEEQRKGDEWRPVGKVSSTTADNPT